MKKLEEKTIIVNDQAIRFYHLKGSNSFLPHLVFLHGWRSESRVWLPALKYFTKEGFDIHLIDLPGFGGSENPQHAFSVGDYTEIIRIIIDRLGLLNAVVIGHSFGGRVGIKLASSYPDLLEKLVLVDAAGVRVARVSLALRKVLAKIVKPLFALWPLSRVRKTIYRKMGADDYISTPELNDTFKKIVSEDLEPLLPQVKTKTLLIWGENDTATTLEEAHIMHTRIPSSELIVLKDAGHYSFLDQPREFGKAVINFLK